ncbi:MAG TPA: porin family protein [Candidatus Babeliaceae bacterium]|nr:porin family protein [Candidatus Babeliaceae bacterium]HVZ95738.1 porin family protein [Chitinophagaceae bacterium]
MKTRLFLLALLFLMSSAGFSQFSLGIKAGANLAKVDGQPFKDQFALGYHAGAFATIGLGKKFAIQPEVLFNQINTDTTSNFSDVFKVNNVSSIQLKYLTIPLLLNYNLDRFISLQFGPQFGVLMNQNENLLQNGQDAFKSGEFSMVGGVQLKIFKFRVYGRYAGGVTDIRNFGNNDTWKPAAVQLGLGLAL